MDAQASETMRETFVKEQKFIRETYRRLEEAGKIPATPPEEKARLAAKQAELDNTKNASGLVRNYSSFVLLDPFLRTPLSPPESSHVSKTRR